MNKTIKRQKPLKGLMKMCGIQAVEKSGIIALTEELTEPEKERERNEN